MRTFLTLALAILATLGAASAPAPGALPVKWEHQFPWPVLTLVASESGVGLAGSDQGNWIRAYDIPTGRAMWGRSLRAGAWSSPTVRGNNVYVVPHDQTLMALRLESGDLLWWKGPRFPRTDPPLPGLSQAPSLNRARPLANTEHVLTLSLDGVVTVLSTTGKIVATADLQPGRIDGDQFWATPAVMNGTVYAATVRGRLWSVPIADPDQARSSEILAAEDRKAGTGAREVRAPLLAFKDRIYLSTMDGTVRAVEGRSDLPNKTWTRPLGPPGVYQSTPGGLALAQPIADTSGQGALYVSLRDRVVKLSPDTGTILWSHVLAGQVTTNPTLWGDSVLVGLAQGRLEALDASTGKSRWAAQLPAEPTAGPVVWQDNAVVGFADGRIQCYDLSAMASPASPSPSSSPAAMRIPR